MKICFLADFYFRHNRTSCRLKNTNFYKFEWFDVIRLSTISALLNLQFSQAVIIKKLIRLLTKIEF